MKLRKNVYLLLLFAVMFLLPSNLSFASEGSRQLDDFVGTYRGSYYANQGHTGLTLKVYLEGSDYKAKFNFYSVPENPSVPTGEYICDVTYDKEKDRYMVIGKEWVNKPRTYYMVNLNGVFDGLTYNGNVEYTGYSGYQFNLVKQIEKNEPSKWADKTVDSAIMDGIIPLELQGNYKDPITRAEFTRIIMATINKLFKHDAVMEILSPVNHFTVSNFQDTQDKFVLAASGLNIIEGYGNGKFGPDDLLTREQAAKILTNMLDVLEVRETNRSAIRFSDENKISPWAKDYVKFITACHADNLDTLIMEGAGNNFNPLGEYTKEQSYLTVYRLLGYVEQKNPN